MLIVLEKVNFGLTKLFKIFKNVRRPGKQQLRALSVLAEDPCVVPNSHIRQLTVALIQLQGFSILVPEDI